MKILDFKYFAQFQNHRFVKVLRHKDSKRDLWELRNLDGFTKYQNRQSWDVFGKAKYIISFIAERHKYAKFVGVWEILSKYKRRPKGFRYRTKKLSGFKDLEGRLIVLWGEGTRSWAQWLHSEGNKTVSELLPPNYVMDFPGYYNFTLSHEQLLEMVKHPDSNREWRRKLSSVSGVYVLLDQVDGKQYVGSAYGTGGIWARWKRYVISPSGGNQQLKKLLGRKPTRYKRFQFSLLRVLELGTPKDEVISQEIFIKHKLGSRAFGLNSN